MYCEKDETIRLLSLYLRETQAQYNDCFSEAAEQDTRLELQRDAIQSLQKTIICKDLVYYSLLIKAQELFRGRIGDVRLVRSKMDGLVRSKKYLEEKCRRIKRLWRDADRELRRIKCITSYEANSQQGSQCKDCSTWTDDVEFDENTKMRVNVNFLLRENEDLKRQLKNRRLEFDLFDREVKNHLSNDNHKRELSDSIPTRQRDMENCPVNDKFELEFLLKEYLTYARILIDELKMARERETSKTDSTISPQANENGISIKDELRRRNDELEKLISEARDKQEELGMLRDMRKQFEKTENLERMNECLKRELKILRKIGENECCAEENSNFPSTEADDKIIVASDEMTISREEAEIHKIKRLKDQLSSTRELTEESLAELRVSKEMLSFLRERICSLKRLLKEKSDEMAKLQADHQMIKNDYTILKMENGIFAEKAHADIQEFRETLKALQSELHLVDENYRRVSEDFDKSQRLLIEAAQREVELQHGITAMEQIFCSKLTSAEFEVKRLSELVDNLRGDLENSREELSARREDFAKKFREACQRMESLEDKVARLEDTKSLLSRELQDCRLENCELRAENARLMENGCRCVKELEDTHNALLELKGECKTKTETLNSVSAELNHVAASRSELCDESQRVVACIRAWIDEQRCLVENLSKKLKNEKNRIAQYAFEKRALVATVRELTRVNGTLSEFSMGRKSCQTRHSPGRRYSRSNGYQTSGMYNRSQKSNTTSSTTVHTRPLKRRCVCLTKTSRRTLLRGNSWWFPKLEHVSKELCCKNRRGIGKMSDEWPSETSMDEARDFGYQSSASK